MPVFTDPDHLLGGIRADQSPVSGDIRGTGERTLKNGPGFIDQKTFAERPAIGPVGDVDLVLAYL